MDTITEINRHYCDLVNKKKAGDISPAFFEAERKQILTDIDVEYNKLDDEEKKLTKDFKKWDMAAKVEKVCNILIPALIFLSTFYIGKKFVDKIFKK